MYNVHILTPQRVYYLFLKDIYYTKLLFVTITSGLLYVLFNLQNSFKFQMLYSILKSIPCFCSIPSNWVIVFLHYTSSKFLLVTLIWLLCNSKFLISVSTSIIDVYTHFLHMNNCLCIQDTDNDLNVVKTFNSECLSTCYYPDINISTNNYKYALILITKSIHIFMTWYLFFNLNISNKFKLFNNEFGIINLKINKFITIRLLHLLSFVCKYWLISLIFNTCKFI